MITETLIVVALSTTTALEPLWRWCCDHTSAYAMFVGGCFLAQIFAYFLGCLPYIFMDHLKLRSLEEYKIQSKKYATTEDFMGTARRVLVSFTTVILPLLSFGGFFLPYLGISRDGPLPTWDVLLLQLAFFLIVEDYLNYWFHRWLHTPWLYKHVHSVHHEHDAPFSIVAAHAHPAEVILQAIPSFVGPIVVSPHLYTLMLWQIVRNFEAIDIHSGYELPFSIKAILPFYAGADHHDYHHFMHSGNFASIFTWCDILYGTDLGYKNYKLRSS